MIEKSIPELKGIKSFPNVDPFVKELFSFPPENLPLAGRLSCCTENWAKLISDSETLQIVKGCKMEFTQQPMQTTPPREHKFSVSEKKTNRKGDRRLRIKGGCQPLSRIKGGCQSGSSCSRPVHKQLISSQEKRRKKSANNKCEAFEWLCGVSVLQNGRYFSPERSVETKRLDGQAGSEGRILLCPDAQGLQEISSFVSSGELQEGIQLPSIWLRPSPSQIHEDIQASSDIPPKEGNALDYIQRRHNNPESESAGSDKGYSDIHSTVFGVCDKLGEVPSGTNSDIGIPGHVDRLCNHDSVPSREEVGCHHSEMSVPACKNRSDDQGGFRTDRHVISQCMSSVVSSLALQEVTNDSDRGSFQNPSHTIC